MIENLSYLIALVLLIITSLFAVQYFSFKECLKQLTELIYAVYDLMNNFEKALTDDTLSDAEITELIEKKNALINEITETIELLTGKLKFLIGIFKK